MTPAGPPVVRCSCGMCEAKRKAAAGARERALQSRSATLLEQAREAVALWRTGPGSCTPEAASAMARLGKTVQAVDEAMESVRERGHAGGAR